MSFVLVEIGAAAAPEVGSSLQAYSDSALSADLIVSNYQRRPFLIADIVSGMPKVGDSIAVGGRRSTTESSPPALPRETPAPRQVAPEPLPRAESVTEFLPRPTREGNESAVVDRSAPEVVSPPPVKPEGPLEAAGAGAGAKASGGEIIPGLPVSRKKTP